MYAGDTELKLSAANGAILNRRVYVSHGTTTTRVENKSTLETTLQSTLGHTLASIDPAGVVYGGFTYGPFGEQTFQVGALTHSRRINGKEEDSHTGLTYYGYRYYDPVAMVWTQGDPLYRFAPDVSLEEPRRQNLYTYSGNNPLRYVDPDGRDIVLVGKKQPEKIGLSNSQIVRAAKNVSSLKSVSRELKASKVVDGPKSFASALKGRSDSKVAYLGHANLIAPELMPSDAVSPKDVATAVAGMKSPPTDLFIFGCDTIGTGFAEQLSEMLPGVTVHAFAGDVDVRAEGPTKKGKIQKEHAVLVEPQGAKQFRDGKPAAPEKEKSKQ